MKFNATLEYYILQNDVSYTKYPFATEGNPNRTQIVGTPKRAKQNLS